MAILDTLSEVTNTADNVVKWGIISAICVVALVVFFLLIHLYLYIRERMSITRTLPDPQINKLRNFAALRDDFSEFSVRGVDKKGRDVYPKSLHPARVKLFSQYYSLIEELLDSNLSKQIMHTAGLGCYMGDAVIVPELLDAWVEDNGLVLRFDSTVPPFILEDWQDCELALIRIFDAPDLEITEGAQNSIILSLNDKSK